MIRPGLGLLFEKPSPKQEGKHLCNYPSPNGSPETSSTFAQAFFLQPTVLRAHSGNMLDSQICSSEDACFPFLD